MSYTYDHGVHGISISVNAPLSRDFAEVRRTVSYVECMWRIYICSLLYFSIENVGSMNV